MTPSSAARNITALAIGTPQSLDSTFSVSCAQPGSHTYRFSIQPLTVRFGPRNLVYGGTGGSAEVYNRGHIEDVVEWTTTPVERVRDGDRDMMLHFASAASGLQRADTEACAKGSFTDGATGRTYRFFGCDAVRVVQF
ncbi:MULTISPECIES: hypothetical protein [unclassified Streptomyces]|uniref:hypothetical protein n=1 Tax=unclassified Streptomyces TaxID=2593676 RepID=UPI0028854F65|nr:hypothetical protein [Streptomyces sp. DSM 41633]